MQANESGESLLTVLVFHLCRHAVLHRLTQEVGCRGMFSTHYHRLATDHASDPTVRYFSCRYAQYIVANDYYCECSLKMTRDRESNNPLVLMGGYYLSEFTFWKVQSPPWVVVLLANE